MTKPNRILWADRDAGQKFSLIMASLFGALVASLMVYAGITAALDGEWWGLIAPAGFLVLIGSMLLEWRRRNAR